MPQVQISKTAVSYEKYVDETLIPGIRKMQEVGLAFLSFGVIGVSIEVLGSFFDSDPLEREGLSRKRFNQAIKDLFIPINSKYNECTHKHPKHGNYCLYTGLRCGMAHLGKPQGRIAFTTRREAIEDKNEHLKKDVKGSLILVAEDLADDFATAWSNLKKLSAKKKTRKRVTRRYLRIGNYTVTAGGADTGH